MYEGALLSGWFDEKFVKAACHAGAEKGGERMTHWTRINTPVETGELRAGWRQKLVVVYPSARGLVYESGVETNVEYAPHIEHGWALGHEPDPHTAYIIRPRRPGGWLSWIDRATGRRVFARSVLHPGSHGQHMIAIGAAMTEHEFAAFMEPILHRWAFEQEHSNHTHVVIRGRL